MKTASAKTRRMVDRPAPTPIPALWAGERLGLVGTEDCGGGSSVGEGGEGRVVPLPVARTDVLVARLDVLGELLISEDCHSIWNIGAARVRLDSTIVDPDCAAVKGILRSECLSMTLASPLPSHWPISKDVDVATETQVWTSKNFEQW